MIAMWHATLFKVRVALRANNIDKRGYTYYTNEAKVETPLFKGFH